MRAELSDRLIHYSLSTAYDCWGHRRPLARYRRNGIWCVSGSAFDVEELNAPQIPPGDARADVDHFRAQAFDDMARSGDFTALQLLTLHALAFGRLTVRELAARHGVSRQAVIARLRGNSRHQGGLLRRVRRAGR